MAYPMTGGPPANSNAKPLNSMTQTTRLLIVATAALAGPSPCNPSRRSAAGRNVRHLPRLASHSIQFQNHDLRSQ